MPDNNQAGQTPQAAQERKEEKPKTPSGLENLANEGYGALINSINYGLAFAGGALTTYFLGARAGLSIWGGSVYGDRMANQLRDKPTTSGETRNRGLEATIRAPMVVESVGTLKAIPPAFALDQITGSFLVGAGGFFGLMPLISAVGMATRYTIEKYLPTAKTENKTYKSIKEYFKENYWKRLKQRLPLSALGSTAIGITYANPGLSIHLFPFLAVTRLFYNSLIQEGKVMYRRLLYPSTYLPNFLNPFYMGEGIGNLGSRLYARACRLGNTIRNLLTPKQAPISPQTAAAAT